MNRTRAVRASIVLTAGLAALVAAGSAATVAQAPPAAPAPTPTPRAAAPIDLTGYWVSVVTEDWRWRMLTAPKGDFASLPLNAEGIKVGNTWDPANAASDGCKAYGAAAVMREPGRLHITWDNERQLRIETDAGAQTRVLVFDKESKPAGPRTWQGHSIAQWETFAARGGATPGQGPARVGSLMATTTNLRAGYLRKNGAPYSEAAVMTEHFDRFVSSGSEWLTVITQIDDPKYLNQPYLTSTHFKREPDGARWSPSPCEKK